MSTFNLTNHRDFVAQDWSEKRQLEKGDCLMEGSVQICPEGRKLGLVQNDVARLRNIWFRKFTKEQRFVFGQRFGYIAELLNVEIEPALLRAALEFWDPSYRCFSFKTVDLAPTYEEYCQILGVYSDFPIKLYVGAGDVKRVEFILYKCTNIDRTVSQKQFTIQRNRKVLNTDFIWPYIEDHLSEESSMRCFALLIYGLVLFPTVRNGIDVHIIHLFEQVVEGKINPIPAILAETYRSLNFCRQNPDGKFHACASLLCLWLKSHFEPTVIPRSKGLYRDYGQRPETGSSSQTKDTSYWMAYLYELDKKELRWVSEFGVVKGILWKCRDMGYLPLPGVWGEIGYTPLMVLRQFGITQFTPVTDFLRGEGFKYTDPGSIERTRLIADAWKRLDRIMIDEGESTEVTDKYQHWTSNRIRDVAALKNWVIDPASYQSPKEEEKVVEKYRKLLDRKMDDFNSLMGKMQSELESQKWITETQDEKIELAEKGKRKAIQEKESVRECNAQLNDTLRKLQRFMLIRMVKTTDMEEAMDKVKAKCAEELDQEKKKSAHQRRLHEKERQEWEGKTQRLVEGIQDRDSQILELKRQIQKLQKANQGGGEWRLRYEELRNRVDRNQDSQVAELKEQVRRQNLQIQELQRVNREDEGRYEELRDRMDQQLAAAAREIQERKEQIEQLRSDFESLEMAYQRNERELIQRRAEACRIRQEYTNQAEEWVSQWGSVRREYEEKIRHMTTQIDMAIKTAAKVYALIKDYREDALRGCKGLPSLPDFLSDILMLFAEIEKFVIHI